MDVTKTSEFIGLTYFPGASIIDFGGLDGPRGPGFLGRSVMPCKKYGFLFLFDPGPGASGVPGLSVGLPGASGRLPKAPGI